jgi:hypothetical protein
MKRKKELPCFEKFNLEINLEKELKKNSGFDCTGGNKLNCIFWW